MSETDGGDPGEVRRGNGLRRRSRKGRLARQHLEAHNGECVDIGARIDVILAGELFGRHVRRGAGGHPCAREARIIRGLLERTRNAEVGQQRVPILQQDVLRLDVAMDEPARVCLGQRVSDLRQYSNRVANGQLSLSVETLPKGLPRNPGRDVVQQSVFRASGEDGQDVGVLQLRGQRDLALEARGADLTHEIWREHLHDNLAIERSLRGHEEPAHAAGRQLAVYTVGIS